MLKAADAQADAAEIFKAVGSPAVIREGDGSAASSLDAIAKEMVRKSADSAAPLDYPQAMAIAAAENPDLYAEHRRESSTVDPN
jgi:hypothetical protein